jgi:hypothetical protein
MAIERTEMNGKWQAPDRANDRMVIERLSSGLMETYLAAITLEFPPMLQSPVG